MIRRSALSKKRRRRGGGGEQAHVLGQLGDERQREIASDAIDARRHQADDRCGPHAPGPQTKRQAGLVR